MIEALRGYESGSPWKSMNLFMRDLAFRADYVHRILDTGVIQKGNNVVEFGSGQGHKSKSLLRSFPDINFTGVELSPKMIVKAKKRLPRINFIQGDMTKFQDIPNEIDVACYFQSLHHLDLQGRSEAAEVIHKKLPEKGNVIVIDSFAPEVQSDIYDASYRAYAVLSQYPGNKLQQTYHSARSLIVPGDYKSADYGYFSPEKGNILGDSQSELFELKHQITPFGGVAISDILVFEKR